MVSLSLALSGLAHTFVILASPAIEPRAWPHAQLPVELSIEQHAPTEQQPTSVPPPSAETTSLLPRPIGRAPRAGGARLPANAVLHVADQSRVEKTATSAGLASPESASKPLDIVPRASLLAAEDREGLERRRNGTTDREAEHVLNMALSAAANQPAYRERRPPPKLVAAADGGYDYTAHASAGTVLLFRAHIAQDGTVRFEDGAKLQLAPIPISGSFALDDLVRRGERHTAEKRWFLEQTAALRERLAAEALRTMRMRVGHLRR